jgi:hypothetical protein
MTAGLAAGLQLGKAAAVCQLRSSNLENASLLMNMNTL